MQLARRRLRGEAGMQAFAKACEALELKGLSQGW